MWSVLFSWQMGRPGGAGPGQTGAGGPGPDPVVPWPVRTGSWGVPPGGGPGPGGRIGLI